MSSRVRWKGDPAISDAIKQLGKTINIPVNVRGKKRE
jgi:hypothetical protein